MITVRVFVNETGQYGSPAGVVLDTRRQIPEADRQEITGSSGYSEVVFINDLESNQVSIYNPQQEIRFSGYALLAAVKQLSQLKSEAVKYITGVAGKFSCGTQGNEVWLIAPVSELPPWNFEQLDSPEEVNKLDVLAPENKTRQHTFIWAWLDEPAGIIRARTFAPDWGIPEDEANGSGSMKLSYMLQRKLQIIHGRGSLIKVTPEADGMIMLSGMVDDRRILN